MSASNNPGLWNAMHTAAVLEYRRTCHHMCSGFKKFPDFMWTVASSYKHSQPFAVISSTFALISSTCLTLMYHFKEH